MLIHCVEIVCDICKKEKELFKNLSGENVAKIIMNIGWGFEPPTTMICPKCLKKNNLK